MQTEPVPLVIRVLSKAKSCSTNISLAKSKALREIRKDNSLIVVPANKSHATVVMDRQVYNAKVASFPTFPLTNL